MNLKNKIRKFYNNSTPIVGLTAYSFNTAKILDKYVDFILVGDSLGMTLYGMKNTQKVTIDMMINHGKAVTKGAKDTLVIVDLPYRTYERSPLQAYETACKVIDTTGCYGVKLEGGKEIANTVSYLTNRGIKVMGHIGLLPQSIVNFKKIKISGFKKLEKEKLLDDAKALFNSGVFSIVIEAVAETAAKLIVREIMKNKEKFVPIIGIGASKHCNGQILVTDDIIGASYKFKDKKIPKFVKVYNESNLESSVKKFCEEVKKKVFPGDEYVYKNSMKIFNNITYLQFSNKK
tara:strand:+ start:134 stop:1003 length:870 start_codon:yes stop_codon:yes gene_type:complete